MPLNDAPVSEGRPILKIRSRHYKVLYYLCSNSTISINILNLVFRKYLAYDYLQAYAVCANNIPSFGFY